MFLIAAVILLASCTRLLSRAEKSPAPPPLPREQVERETQSIKEENIADVDLKTEDKINIKGTFYKGSNNTHSIILLHMLGRTRSDWNDFALELQKLGYNVLAVDLRGHVQSDSSWRIFSDSDFNKMILDVKAAKEFLTTKGIRNNTVIIGASIGANVALKFAGQDDSVKAIVLLSPGLDYRGVKTEEAMKKFTKPILIVASENDAYAADSSKTLESLSKNSTLKIYSGARHGTDLFGKTDVNKVIVDWIDKNLK